MKKTFLLLVVVAVSSAFLNVILGALLWAEVQQHIADGVRIERSYLLVSEWMASAEGWRKMAARCHERCQPVSWRTP